MILRIGSRVFAPGWVASLVTLALAPGLTGLGFWQLDRAQEKRDLMIQAEQGRQQRLTLNPLSVDQLNRYQQVSVRGHYDSHRQLLLDNMPSTDPSTQGQPGYRVLTPLIVAAVTNETANVSAHVSTSSSIILVDRGWLPLQANRQQLPALDVPEQLREVSGLLDELPQPGVRAGMSGIQETVWPQLLNYPKVEELRQLYGSGLQTRIVLLDADQPDGYQRTWQINLGFTSDRHIGYAVQWFGLAVTLLIIYVVVNLKRPELVVKS